MNNVRSIAGLTFNNGPSRYPRYPVHLPVELDIDGRTLPLNTGDLSMGGMFVAWDGFNVRIGQKLQLRFAVPTTWRTIKSEVEVIHTQKTLASGYLPGCGVRFVALDPCQEDILEQYVQTLQQDKLLFEMFVALNTRRRQVELSATERHSWSALRLDLEDKLFPKGLPSGAEDWEDVLVPVCEQAVIARDADRQRGTVIVFGESHCLAKIPADLAQGCKVELRLLPITSQFLLSFECKTAFCYSEKQSQICYCGLEFVDVPPSARSTIQELVDGSLRNCLLRRIRPVGHTKLSGPLSVEITVDERTLTSQATDINQLGMFLPEEGLPISPGETYKFRLDMPVGKRTIEGDFEVVHLEQGVAPEQQSGYVGRFLGLTAKDRLSLEVYLSQFNTTTDADFHDKS